MYGYTRANATFIIITIVSAKYRGVEYYIDDTYCVYVSYVHVARKTFIWFRINGKYTQQTGYINFTYRRNY